MSAARCRRCDAEITHGGKVCGCTDPDALAAFVGGLEGLLNQATPDGEPPDLGGYYVACTRLHQLAPETTAWAIKAAAELKHHFVSRSGGCRLCDDWWAADGCACGMLALLAEFDRLNEKADQ